MDKKVETRGRPPGVGNKITIGKVQNDLLRGSVKNVKELVDKGDPKTSVQVLKILAPLIPSDPVTLTKVNDIETGRKALAQLVDLYAAGKIPDKTADRLFTMLHKYIDSHVNEALRERVKELEQDQGPIEIRVIPPEDVKEE